MELLALPGRFETGLRDTLKLKTFDSPPLIVWQSGSPEDRLLTKSQYKEDLRKYLGKGLADEQWAQKNVVVVVCGGSNINLEMLEKYRNQFGV